MRAQPYTDGVHRVRARVEHFLTLDDAARLLYGMRLQAEIGTTWGDDGSAVGAYWYNGTPPELTVADVKDAVRQALFLYGAPDPIDTEYRDEEEARLELAMPHARRLAARAFHFPTPT